MIEERKEHRAVNKLHFSIKKWMKLPNNSINQRLSHFKFFSNKYIPPKLVRKMLQCLVRFPGPNLVLIEPFKSYSFKRKQ